MKAIACAIVLGALILLPASEFEKSSEVAKAITVWLSLFLMLSFIFLLIFEDNSK